MFSNHSKKEEFSNNSGKYVRQNFARKLLLLHHFTIQDIFTQWSKWSYDFGRSWNVVNCNIDFRSTDAQWKLSFHWNPELLDMGRQIGQIILVQWVSCPCFPLFIYYFYPNIYLELGFEFEFGPQRIRDLAFCVSVVRVLIKTKLRKCIQQIVILNLHCT